MARRVLLTGAAGRVASAFHEHTGDRYWLRLADRTTEPQDNAFEIFNIGLQG